MLIKGIETNGKGSLNPDILFVGENLGVDKEDVISWSGYLRYSLDGAGIENFHITAAIKPWLETQDEMHFILMEEVRILNPKMVVAMGRVAEKFMLKVRDIYPALKWFDAIPHPSFFMNFYPDQQAEYVAILKSLKRKLYETEHGRPK